MTIADPCARCHLEPAARVTRQTALGAERWCAGCRRQYIAARVRDPALCPEIFAERQKPRKTEHRCGYCNRLTVGFDETQTPACRAGFGCNRSAAEI